MGSLAAISTYSCTNVGGWAQEGETGWQDFACWIVPHLSHSVDENGKSKWEISPLGEILDCALTET